MITLQKMRYAAIGMWIGLSPAVTTAQQAYNPGYLPTNLDAMKNAFDACIAEYDRRAAKATTPSGLLPVNSKGNVPLSAPLDDGQNEGTCNRIQFVAYEEKAAVIVNQGCAFQIKNK